eukprot:NODE_737_length_4687_cov_0.414778.p1 type:complete len:280 gc:universal NODE_737_length_4687_cov_0.414778:2080-1241(-)
MSFSVGDKVFARRNKSVNYAPGMILYKEQKESGKYLYEVKFYLSFTVMKTADVKEFNETAIDNFTARGVNLGALRQALDDSIPFAEMLNKEEHTEVGAKRKASSKAAGKKNSKKAKKSFNVESVKGLAADKEKENATEVSSVLHEEKHTIAITKAVDLPSKSTLVKTPKKTPAKKAPTKSTPKKSSGKSQVDSVIESDKVVSSVGNQENVSKQEQDKDSPVIKTADIDVSNSSAQPSLASQQSNDEDLLSDVSTNLSNIFVQPAKGKWDSVFDYMSLWN